MAAKAKPAKTGVLGRTLEQMLDALPPGERARVEARSTELHAEVEGLKAGGSFSGEYRPEPRGQAACCP
ncbi:hypothetical protein WSK_1979 [Novosphingobium sp. Rr 2-17]|uniref:hypothetical protein n=1 Tax=Novosphingobium sp. Rr 2-17 TaxID=555793 RepID=UPI00026981F3|nr:hypothetical protein [Novosphingobium sp. Rr 2-17]EIZ79439.1 hypothetical protein WSK_1979 [Novosphingobium sp. Rr 2-17]